MDSESSTGLLIPMRHSSFLGFSPRATISPPISTMKFVMPFFARNCAITSTAYPLATALHESIMRSSCFTTLPSSDRTTFVYPVISSRLSIIAESGNAPFLKPNPQALASGATVISNAPFVSLDISILRRNTFVKKVSGTISSFRLIRVIVAVSLKGDSEPSNLFNSSSISAFRSSSY
ncbi:Uncharacterised protein [uncultured Bacteroides sp.]|nr:Uncharacterised protein [uncultured Bacteroides sp.]